MNYIAHVCKNSRLKPSDPNYCDRIWVDEDRYNASKPPTYKYCPECVKKGFKNKRRIKKTMSPEQVEAFKQRMKEYREKVKNSDNR